ncbi:MAG TPA: hypothetical protein VI451_06045, partial [Anaerolineales bacterium]|nr:hypothetical protein [Anaerolineales bacterium]
KHTFFSGVHTTVDQNNNFAFCFKIGFFYAFVYFSAKCLYLVYLLIGQTCHVKKRRKFGLLMA